MLEYDAPGIYTVEVQAYGVGCVSEKATAVFEAPAARILPRPVIHVPATHVVGSPLTITWDALGNVESYYVHVDCDADDALSSYYRLDDGTAFSYTMPGTAFPVPGSYQVQVVSYNDGRGKYSEEAEIRVVANDGEPLDTPQIHEITAVVGGGCTISWDSVEGAEGYIVSAKTGDDNYSAEIMLLSSLAFLSVLIIGLLLVDVRSGID